MRVHPTQSVWEGRICASEGKRQTLRCRDLAQFGRSTPVVRVGRITA